MVSDAESILRLSALLDSETNFMLFEPGERTTALEEQEDLLRKFSESSDVAMMVAVDGINVVGFAMTTRTPFKRIRHLFRLVIGVQKSYWGAGVGKQLMDAAEQWAASVGGLVLELTVVADNARAISLYEKCGFQIDGTRPKSLLIDGKLVDELYMSKFLDQEAFAK